MKTGRTSTSGSAARVETHIVRSEHAPGGFGETAVPPAAPAIANAIFAATGKRMRRLPITSEKLRATNSRKT